MGGTKVFAKLYSCIGNKSNKVSTVYVSPISSGLSGVFYSLQAQRKLMVIQAFALQKPHPTF